MRDHEFSGQVVDAGKGVALDRRPRLEPAREGVQRGLRRENEGRGGERGEHDGGERPAARGPHGDGVGKVEASRFFRDLADRRTHQRGGNIRREVARFGQLDDALQPVAERFEMPLEQFREFRRAAPVPQPMRRPALREPRHERAAAEGQDRARPARGVHEAVEDEEEDERGEQPDDPARDRGERFQAAQPGFIAAELRDQRIGQSDRIHGAVDVMQKTLGGNRSLEITRGADAPSAMVRRTPTSVVRRTRRSPDSRGRGRPRHAAPRALTSALPSSARSSKA